MGLLCSWELGDVQWVVNWVGRGEDEAGLSGIVKALFFGAAECMLGGSMERAIPILPADDLAAAKGFYVNGLGFRVTFEATKDGRTGLMGAGAGDDPADD